MWPAKKVGWFVFRTGIFFLLAVRRDRWISVGATFGYRSIIRGHRGLQSLGCCGSFCIVTWLLLSCIKKSGKCLIKGRGHWLAYIVIVPRLCFSLPLLGGWAEHVVHKILFEWLIILLFARIINIGKEEARQGGAAKGVRVVLCVSGLLLLCWLGPR